MTQNSLERIATVLSDSFGIGDEDGLTIYADVWGGEPNAIQIRDGREPGCIRAIFVAEDPHDLYLAGRAELRRAKVLCLTCRRGVC